MVRVNDNQHGIASAVDQQTATTAEIGRNTASAAMGSAELAENVAALVGHIRLTAYAGAHARSVAAELARIEESLTQVLAPYRFTPVALDIEAEVDLRGTGVQTAGNTTTVYHYVFGTGINEIDYSPDWRHSKANLESSGSDSYCGMANGVATARFVGTGVRYYGFAEANHGMIALSIDDGPETIVDQYGDYPREPDVLAISGAAAWDSCLARPRDRRSESGVPLHLGDPRADRDRRLASRRPAVGSADAVVPALCAAPAPECTE